MYLLIVMKFKLLGYRYGELISWCDAIPTAVGSPCGDDKNSNDESVGAIAQGETLNNNGEGKSAEISPNEK